MLKQAPAHGVYILNPDNLTDYTILDESEYDLLLMFGVVFADGSEGKVSSANYKLIKSKDRLLYQGQVVFSRAEKGVYSISYFSIRYGNVLIVYVLGQTHSGGFLFLDLETLEFLGSYSSTMGYISTKTVAWALIHLSDLVNFNLSVGMFDQ